MVVTQGTLSFRLRVFQRVLLVIITICRLTVATTALLAVCLSTIPTSHLSPPPTHFTPRQPREEGLPPSVGMTQAAQFAEEGRHGMVSFVVMPRYSSLLRDAQCIIAALSGTGFSRSIVLPALVDDYDSGAEASFTEK